MKSTTMKSESPASEAEPTFEGLGIEPKFLAMLNRAGFTTPTPIQAQSMPITTQGQDVLGIAQTGTGKTLAFGIPMIQRLVQHKGMGLVVLPTRELAVQVEHSLQRIGKELGLKTALLIGGEAMGKQLRALKFGPHIIIATPGRLIDHMEQKTVNLSTVKVLVLDEADRMLDMGFAPQLKRILQEVPTERQTMLFSATMPDAIVSIAKNFMHIPVRVEVARPGTAASTITQEVVFVHRQDKLPVLKTILTEEQGTALVFTRTKHGAKKVAKLVRDWGFTSAELHSNRSLSQRLAALQGFKQGRYRVLVATDIAARGIDAAGISLVVNYDLPAVAEDYVHRIGRTGRAGRAGKAIAIATLEERRDVRDIERLIGQMLPVKQMGPLDRNIPMSVPDERPERESRGRRPSGRSSSPFGSRPARSGFGGNRGRGGNAGRPAGRPGTARPSSGRRFNRGF